MDLKLYEAVTRDNIDVLKEMEKGLQVGDQLTPTNSTVLHLACQYGSINCVKEILSVHESLLLKINSRGETALHLAASQGHYDVVGALIDAAKYSSRLQPNNLTHTSLTVVQILIRTTSLELETALHVAVRYKRRDVVQLLVKEDPSHSYPKNKYKETPLYLASFMGEYGIIDTILQNCTSPTFGGPDGRTALHAAAMNTHGSECMKLLLEKTKDLIKIADADNRGWTAYHYVAYNDICEIVEDLVRVDKSVGYLAEKEYERTPLHIAAHEGNKRVLKELVKYYPDCWEVVDVNGQNILHLAVEHYNPDRPPAGVINFILSRLDFGGSNNMLYQRDNEGNTPLHLMTKLECYVHELMNPRINDHFKKVNWDMLNDKNVTPLDILEDKYMTHVFDIVPAADRALVRRTQENVLVYGENRNLWSILQKKHLDKVSAQINKIRRLDWNTGGEEEKEKHRNMINTHMIVAALITTVAFTAGFAMPGGFDQTHGSAVLIRKPAFKTFIAADAVALLFSITSLFLYFIATFYNDDYVQRLWVFIKLAGLLNVCSIVAMMVAFITGTYAVLVPSSGIAITVCVIASSFILFVFCYFARNYPWCYLM